MVYLVGLTGGIGSGKSAAANLFRELGVRVVDADQVARDVVAPGTAALAAITQRHGDAILLEQGGLDRAALRSIIFRDPEERKWLESLTHPLIRESMAQQLGEARVEGEPNYRVLESPLLLETSQREMVQRICLVDASTETQITRVMQRDSSDEAQVRAIINAQMARENKVALADDIIDNNGSLESLSAQVNELHLFYNKLAAEQQA